MNIDYDAAIADLKESDELEENYEEQQSKVLDYALEHTHDSNPGLVKFGRAAQVNIEDLEESKSSSQHLVKSDVIGKSKKRISAN